MGGLNLISLKLKGLNWTKVKLVAWNEFWSNLGCNHLAIYIYIYIDNSIISIMIEREFELWFFS